MLSINPQYFAVPHGKSRSRAIRIVTLDLETDPDMTLGNVRAFAAAIYDGNAVSRFWGSHEDCVDWVGQCLDHIKSVAPDTIVYAHNGGRYDFFLLAELIDDEEEFILSGSRIMRAQARGVEIRDSFSCLPFSLADLGNKSKIDYSIFKKNVRENHKQEILDYLDQDVIVLYEAMKNWLCRFGLKMSASAAALSELVKIEGDNCYEKMQNYNALNFFRKFYNGGKSGLIKSVPGKSTPEMAQKSGDGSGRYDGGFILIDKNSAYPDFMRRPIHPIGEQYRRYKYGEKFPDIKKIMDADFLIIRAKNDFGFLPFVDMRDIHDRRMFWDWDEFAEHMGIDAPKSKLEYEYHITGHELRAGIDTGAIEILSVIETIYFKRHGGFPEFVKTYYQEKSDAKKSGNKISEIFAKGILNRSYGGFGMDAWRFRRTKLALEKPGEKSPWGVRGITECGRYLIDTPFVPTLDQKKWWSERGIDPDGIGRAWLYSRNTALAASITGAARADLWRSICAVDGAVYCDTDSIICRGTGDLKIGDGLGEWKIEGESESLWIAQTKIYVLGVREGKNIRAVKKASAGALLSERQIAEVAEGGQVTYHKDLPAFSFIGQKPVRKSFGAKK